MHNQSAVEWLIDEMNNIKSSSTNMNGKVQFLEKELNNLFEQAKAMEKEQRGYSEIDLEVAFFEGRENNLTFIQWLEKFKNQNK